VSQFEGARTLVRFNVTLWGAFKCPRLLTL
jgi:hypothetical protein